MDYDRPASVAERDAYRALVERRLGGASTATIIGRREFYGRNFAVGDGVLIPRPETEGLIDRIFDRLPAAPLRFADFGAGSGCIGVTLACERPGWQGIMVEKEPVAAGYAAVNLNTWANGADLQLVEADALRPQAWAKGRFDLVVANPPYLTRAEWASAAPEVRQEPLAALCYGDHPDGADWYRRLAEQLASLLAAGALVALEIGIRQSAVVKGLLAAAGAERIEILRDFADHERFVLARLPKDA